MNYSQIRAFHAVAKTGSITAAADFLNLTQPAVTLQIKALEEHYGIALLSRSRRQITLTQAGDELFLHARRLFSVVGEIEEYLGSMGKLERGRLSIGADNPLHVMELMAAFNVQYPKIEIAISFGNTKDLKERLHNYECDVVIASDFDEASRIHSQYLSSSVCKLIVAESHKWAKRDWINISELGGVPMISREIGSATRACIERGFAEKGIIANYILEMGNQDAIQVAVAQKIGVAIIQESSVRNDPRLHKLEIRGVDFLLKEYVHCLRERRASRIVAAFLEIADQLKSNFLENSLN